LTIALDSDLASSLIARAPLTPDDFADFARRGDADMRLARRRLAKALLAWAGGVHPRDVRIGRSPLGAPVVEAPAGWHLSVSGQGRLCLIGLACTAIGVDIEPRTAPPPPLDLLTLQERSRVESLPPAAATQVALTIWVAKEAHAKRIGVASRIEPAEIETEATALGLTARSGGHVSHCWIGEGEATLAAVALAPPVSQPLHPAPA
jgi:phosphopantetheinyl transferase